MRFTTIRNLSKNEAPYYEGIIRFNEQVFFIKPAKDGGYLARIYEMIDLDDAPSELDTMLALVAKSDVQFVDNGHAIKWCFENA